VDYALRVYDYYSKDVDVHATDRPEVVTLARGADDSLEVTIAVADGGPSPWYRRRFLPGETDAVRVYLHGGDDRMTRTGPADGPSYRAEQTVAFATPTLRYELGRRFETYLGPEVRYSETAFDDNTTIGIGEAYGTGKFGQFAVRGGLHFDSRARPDTSESLNIAEGLTEATGDEQVSGVNIRAAGFFVPEAWDATSSYGGVDGVVAAYLGSPRAHVAVRVGGRHLWGDYPWFEAAPIGGLNNRGFVSRRFIGDSSLFGGVSLRGWLGRVRFPIVPMRLGLVAFLETGRVWHGVDESKTWHTSAGGGLLLQPLAAPITLHAVVGHSKESTLFYFGLGYPF
jgi:hypothetical protein